MIKIAILIFIDKKTSITKLIEWCLSIKYPHINYYIFIKDTLHQDIDLEIYDDMVHYNSIYELNFYNLEVLDYYYHYITLNTDKPFDYWLDLYQDNFKNLPNIDKMIQDYYQFNFTQILKKRVNIDRKYYPLLHHITHSKEEIMKDNYSNLNDIHQEIEIVKNKTYIHKLTNNTLLSKLNIRLLEKNYKITRKDIYHKLPIIRLLLDQNTKWEYFYLYNEYKIRLKLDDLTSKHKINKIIHKNNDTIIQVCLPINKIKTINDKTCNSNLLDNSNYLTNPVILTKVINFISKIYLVFDSNKSTEDVKRVKSILTSFLIPSNKIVNCFKNQISAILKEGIKNQYKTIMILDVDIYFHNSFITKLYELIFGSSLNIQDMIYIYLLGINNHDIYGYILTNGIYEILLKQLNTNSSMNNILEDLYNTNRKNVKYSNNLLIKKSMITNQPEIRTEYQIPNELNLLFEQIYFINSKEIPPYQLNHYFYQNKLNIQILELEDNHTKYLSIFKNSNQNTIAYRDWNIKYHIHKILQLTKKLQMENVLIIYDNYHIHNDYRKYTKLIPSKWKLLYLGTEIEKETTQIHHSTISKNTNAFAINNHLYDYIINVINNHTSLDNILTNINNEYHNECFVLPNIISNNNYINTSLPTITILFIIDDDSTINNINKTISSLYNSSYQKLEIIILDTKHIQINTILNKYSNIIYHKLDNKLSFADIVKSSITDNLFISFIRSNYTIHQDRFSLQLSSLLTNKKFCTTCNINNPTYIGMTAIYNRNILSNNFWYKCKNEIELYHSFKEIYRTNDNDILSNVDKILYTKN